MKRNWLIYICVLVATGVLGNRRPGFVSVMMFYMVLCLPIADLLLIVITYNFFKISHKVDKRKVMKGDQVVYDLTIENNTVFLFSPMHLKFAGEELIFSTSELKTTEKLFLHPFSWRNFRKELACDYRGTYAVGVDKVDIMGYLGLFKMAFKEIGMHNIIVYPKIYDLKPIDFKHALSDATESIVSFDKFDKSIFSEVRPYESGDSLKRIHWKLSARYGDFITKEYEGNVNNRTKVMINNESMNLGFEKDVILEDYIVESAVGLVKYLLNNNTPVEMVWHHYDPVKIKGEQPKDFQKFYESLAILNYEKDKTMFMPLIEEETKRQYDKCVLIIFTVTVTDSLAELLMTKKRQGFEVNIVTVNPNGFDIGDEVVNFDSTYMYRLIDLGIRVYHMRFEEGQCRLDVA